jgi:hypothetical protein
MPCVRIRMPGGTVAIACGVRRPRRKCQCGAWASLSCDFPAPARKAGTCDKPLCERCAIHVGADLDNCPHHVDEAKPVPPQQLKLEGL